MDWKWWSQVDVWPRVAMDETWITMFGRRECLSAAGGEEVGMEERISPRPSQPHDVFLEGSAREIFWREGVLAMKAARMLLKS